MKRRLRKLVPAIPIILGLCISSTAMAQETSSIALEKKPESARIHEESEPLVNLFLQLMTRPGVTDDSDTRALRPAAQGAALSLRQSLFQGPGSMVKWARFRKDVGNLVHSYRNEYDLAPEGIAGAEARGAALDHLFDGLLQASLRAGIPLEEFDPAFFQGAAKVEELISERPLSRKLSPTDRELVIYLLRDSVDQVSRRTFLDSTRDALRNLHAAEEITMLYESRLYSVLRPVLSRELVRLENTLADPLFVSDLQNILAAEYNHEATFDLFTWKYAFELYFLSGSRQEQLLSLLVSLIPGMTPELLREQFGQIPFTALGVFASVTPQLQLTYSPVSGLAERLAVLGETPPSPPDFSLFPDPYLALMRMQYDIRLCDQITGKEWIMANNFFQDPPRLLPLNDRLAVKKTAMERLSLVRERLSGVSEETARMMLILMEPGRNMRI